MTNSPEFPDSSVVNECLTTDLVMRLRSENSMPPYYGVPKLQVEAADEIERLRAALKPFARLFLWPDDLGFECAEDIRSDDDWCEDANDMQMDDMFVLRKDIRAARRALAQRGE